MFFHNIYLYIKHLPIYEIFRNEIFRKNLTKIFVNVIINRRLSKYHHKLVFLKSVNMVTFVVVG